MNAEPMNPVTEKIAPKRAPKVSVCVVTYNQEKYIRQCLQSLVDQVVDFDFEIIVSDDASSDGTSGVIMEFAEKYPNLIRPVLHKKNIGAYKNFLFVHSLPMGKYVAHVDGDDYALPGKLQAQVEVLDQDDRCNLVWTPVLLETESGVLHEQSDFFKRNALSRVYKQADVIKYGAIGINSSKMYRRRAGVECDPLPEFDLIDYFVNVIQVADGVARFAGEVPLGVHRLGVGISSAGSYTKVLKLRSIEYFFREFPRYKTECHVAVSIDFFADIKNRRSTVKKSFRLYFKTMTIWGVLSFLGELRFMLNLSFRRKMLKKYSEINS